MKVQLSQIEDFESAPSRIKIQWKERKNGRRQELVNDSNYTFVKEITEMTSIETENSKQKTK